MASLRKNASDDEVDQDASDNEPVFSDIEEEEEPVLEEAAKQLSIVDKEDASENAKEPKDPDSAADTDVPVASADIKQQGGEDGALAADASPEVPLEKTDGAPDSKSGEVDGPTDQTTAAVADEPPLAEEHESNDTAQDDEATNSEKTPSAANSTSDTAADDDPKADGDKPAKVFEPYEVPSFGHHFFCHDDRYMQSNRGRGRGRGGSQLWEKKEPQWEHDGFFELTKNDTAPPRMVREMGDRYRRSDSRNETGRGRRRGGGRRMEGRPAEQPNTAASGVGASEPPEGPPSAAPPPVGGPADGNPGMPYGSDRGGGHGGPAAQGSGRGPAPAPRGPVQGMRGFEVPPVHTNAAGHVVGMMPLPNTVEAQHAGMHAVHFQPGEHQQAAPAPPAQHSVEYRAVAPPAQYAHGGPVDGAAGVPHSAPAEAPHASGRHGRGRGAGRGPGQSRPTFYGREVSAANQTANEHAQRSDRQALAAVGSGEAPSGSRRYLAGRVDPAQAGGTVYTVQGQPTAAKNVQVAMPTMVAVQGGMHQQAQGIHLNPNAPGFLPVGDQPHPQQAAAGGYGNQRSQVQARASGPQQQDQQAPQMQQYLSASTAKGMMLRNELQSMMGMPQAAAPAPANAQGYVQQVYYGPGAVQVSPDGESRFMYAQAPNYPNAQHISVSPVGVQQHPPPEMMVQMPYPQYVVDGHMQPAPQQAAPPAHHA